MKKLISILTISTLTAIVPAPLLANTTLERTKRDVITSNANNSYLSPKNFFNINGGQINSVAINSKTDIYFVWLTFLNDGAFVLKKGKPTPTKIDGISGSIFGIAVDSKDNIYFGTSNGAFVLKQGETKSIKIDGISGNVNSFSFDSKDNIYVGSDDGLFLLKQGITIPRKIISGWIKSIAVDSKDNIYFGTSNGAFVLKQGETKSIKIDKISDNIKPIAVDSKNNVYFGTKDGAFVLKQGETKSIKIDGISGNINSITIDNKNTIYFGSNNGIYFMQTALSWVKQQSQFTLIDSSKNISWLLDDQLVVNGQVKVKMANTNIDTVKVNGAIMPSPDKKWEFELPTDSNTIANKDYKIEIAFRLDGKSYTGQIIVSSMLEQTSIAVQKNTSPFGNIDSYVYQVPANGKVGDTTLNSDLYYSDTEVKVSLNKPTGTPGKSGIVYGLNVNWQKNGQKLDITSDISLNATMLNSYQGRFLVETKDSANNLSFYYISLNKDNLTPNFWDTEKGQTFYQWANLNGYNENIKKLNATELNKIINESKNWQALASDSQFANAVDDWFKTKGKLSSKEPLTAEQVEEQLKTQIPSSITIDGVNTSNYDVNKVSFELNKSEFKPNDKVDIIIKYNDNAKSGSLTLQIKESNTSDNNKKSSLTGWAIVGIAVGSLLGLFILAWLFKKFVVTPFILEPIRKKKAKAFAEKTEKDIAQMKLDGEEWEAKQRGDK